MDPWTKLPDLLLTALKGFAYILGIKAAYCLYKKIAGKSKKAEKIIGPYPYIEQHYEQSLTRIMTRTVKGSGNRKRDYE